MPEPSLELALILLLLGLLVVQSLRLLWLRGRAARQMTRSRLLGEAGERRAEAVLEREGYEILERQTLGGYQLKVDGAPVSINLRADFIAKKDGQIVLAEVKAGRDNATASVRATRRQLLEYTLAFDVDALALVDVTNERVIQIEFPDP